MNTPRAIHTGDLCLGPLHWDVEDECNWGSGDSRGQDMSTQSQYSESRTVVGTNTNE